MKKVASIVLAFSFLLVTAAPSLAHDNWHGGCSAYQPSYGPYYGHAAYRASYAPVAVIPWGGYGYGYAGYSPVLVQQPAYQVGYPAAYPVGYPVVVPARYYAPPQAYLGYRSRGLSIGVGF